MKYQISKHFFAKSTVTYREESIVNRIGNYFIIVYILIKLAEMKVSLESASPEIKSIN